MIVYYPAYFDYLSRDAKRVANIIKEILYLKKDELDKVDGGLPVV